MFPPEVLILGLMTYGRHLLTRLHIILNLEILILSAYFSFIFKTLVVTVTDPYTNTIRIVP